MSHSTTSPSSKGRGSHENGAVRDYSLGLWTVHYNRRVDAVPYGRLWVSVLKLRNDMYLIGYPRSVDNLLSTACQSIHR